MENMKQLVLIFLSLFAIVSYANAQYDVSIHFDKSKKSLELYIKNNTDKLFFLRPNPSMVDLKDVGSFIRVIYKDKNDNVLDKSEWLIYEFLHKGEYRAGQYLWGHENKRYGYRIGGKRRGIYKVEVYVQIEARDIRELDKIYRKELREEYLWE